MAVEWITWALEQALPSGPKFVLVALANRANQDGECWPSQEDLARQTGQTRQSVNRQIRVLCDAGFLEKQERRREDGYKSSSNYILRKNKLRNRSLRNNKAKSQVTQSDNNVSSTKILEPSLGTVSNAREEIASSVPNPFWVWYDRYPHKVGKGAAEKSFWQAIKKTSLENLLDGLDRYIRTKPPDRAWCNPSTWLNQERWLDNPQEIQNAHRNPQKYTVEDAKRDALAAFGIYDEDTPDHGTGQPVLCDSRHLRQDTGPVENPDDGDGSGPPALPPPCH